MRIGQGGSEGREKLCLLWVVSAAGNNCAKLQICEILKKKTPKHIYIAPSK